MGRSRDVPQAAAHVVAEGRQVGAGRCRSFAPLLLHHSARPQARPGGDILLVVSFVLSYARCLEMGLDCVDAYFFCCLKIWLLYSKKKTQSLLCWLVEEDVVVGHLSVFAIFMSGVLFLVMKLTQMEAMELIYYI